MPVFEGDGIPKELESIVLSIPLHTGRSKWTFDFGIHSLSKFLISKAISVEGRSILRQKIP